MSDIVKRDTDGWTAVLPAVGDLAGKIAQTEFVPDALRGKPAAIAAAILYGRELGLEPMTSLRSINVIKGKPTLSAEAMRALVLAAGHDIRFEDMTSARCVIVGRRKGQEDSTTVTFTIDDAKKMGVGGAQQYAKMPRQMLAARATAELCRLIFADAIGGLMVDIEVDYDPDTIATVTPMTTARRARKPVKQPEAVAEEPGEVADDPVDPEPVLDDDIVEAEIVDEPDSKAATLEALLADELGAEPIGETLSGIGRVREALAEAKAVKMEPDKPVSPSQLKAIFAGFRDCGLTDKDEMRTITAALANAPSLDSSKNLTAAQAKAVLDGLAFAKASDNPADLLRKAAQ